MMELLKKNDFSYVIGGETFNKLGFLTDSIYPELLRFIKQSVSRRPILKLYFLSSWK